MTPSVLNAAAQQSSVVGSVADAEKFARELMALSPPFKGDWNHGNASQDDNLGPVRIAGS